MASRNVKDFKGRSRTNMVPRVAKRINQEEKRHKQLYSTMTSMSFSQTSAAAKKRKSRTGSMKHQKVMSYGEIKKWNQNYRLDGKSVYQLDAEFTSLVKIQVQEL